MRSSSFQSFSIFPDFKNSGETFWLIELSYYQFLPLFGKVPEALIKSELVKHLISDKLYGFLFSKTTTNVLTVITIIL